MTFSFPFCPQYGSVESGSGRGIGILVFKSYVNLSLWKKLYITALKLIDTQSTVRLRGRPRWWQTLPRLAPQFVKKKYIYIYIYMWHLTPGSVKNNISYDLIKRRKLIINVFLYRRLLIVYSDENLTKNMCVSLVLCV